MEGEKKWYRLPESGKVIRLDMILRVYPPDKDCPGDKESGSIILACNTTIKITQEEYQHLCVELGVWPLEIEKPEE